MSISQSYEEKELLLKIADGDEKAFEQLFNNYLPHVYPVVFQIVKSDAAVKDIVQDVFMRLWIGRSKLPEVEMPRNYIFRMIYNQSLKYLKRQTGTVELTAGEEMVDDALTPDLLLNVSQARRFVEDAVQQLAPQSQQIYRLHRFSGLKPQEIADRMGINVQSVRNSLTRSAKSIRDHLTRNGIALPLILLVFDLV